MTITREINGNFYEIELTAAEILDAYNSQRHKFDIQEVKNWIELYDPECFVEEFEKDPDEVLKDADLLDDIATEYRYRIDYVDYNTDSAIRAALSCTL